MRNLGFFLFLATVLLLQIQCRKNNPFSCAAYAVEIQDELQRFSTAASAYSTDPSVANCQEYKDALNEYLAAARGYSSCTFTAVEQAEYQESIKEAQESADNLMCQ